jgi:hypothetical protein
MTSAVFFTSMLTSSCCIRAKRRERMRHQRERERGRGRGRERECGWLTVVVCLLVLWAETRGVEGDVAVWSGRHANSLNCGCSRYVGPEVCLGMDMGRYSYDVTQNTSSSSPPPLSVTPDSLIVTSSGDRLLWLSTDLRLLRSWNMTSANVSRSDIGPSLVVSPSDAELSQYSLYFGNADGVLFALTSSLDVTWSLPLRCRADYLQISHSSTLLFVGCSAILPSENSTFLILRTDSGDTVFMDQVTVTGTPAVTPNDRIVVVPTTSGLIGYEMYSETRQYPITLWVREDVLGTSSPSVSSAGDSLLFSTSSAEVVCLNVVTGVTQWVHSSSAKLYYSSSFSVVSGGVAILTSERFVECLSPDGTVNWVTLITSDSTKSFVTGPVTVDLQGQIWVSRSGGKPLLILDKTGDAIGESNSVTCPTCSTASRSASPLVISRDQTAAIIYDIGFFQLRAISDVSCHKRNTPEWGVALLIIVGILAGVAAIGLTVFFVGRSRPHQNVQFEGYLRPKEEFSSYNSFA